MRAYTTTPKYYGTDLNSLLLASSARQKATAAKVAGLWSMSSATAFEMTKVTAGTTDATGIRVALDGCVAVQGGVYASKQGFYDAVASCRRNAESEDKAALDRLTTFPHAH